MKQEEIKDIEEFLIENPPTCKSKHISDVMFD